MVFVAPTNGFPNQTRETLTNDLKLIINFLNRLDKLFSLTLGEQFFFVQKGDN